MSEKNYKQDFQEFLELYIAEYRKANGDEKALEKLKGFSDLKDISVYISNSYLNEKFILSKDFYAHISYKGIQVQVNSSDKFDLSISGVSDFNFQLNFPAFIYGAKSHLLEDKDLPEQEILLVTGDKMEIPVATQIQTKDPVLEAKANILDNLLNTQELVIKHKENK